MQSTTCSTVAAEGPPLSSSLKQCSGCGCVYTHAEFQSLPSFRLWTVDEGDVLGMAECSGCFSTITVQLVGGDS